jgi:2-keto-4-pentenoate hydratase/2-oxohepta-3-ene-1,7-dioic acid hydratase in catechol pathway
MRIVRYQKGSDQPQLGWLYEDQVGPIEGDLFGEYQRGEALTPAGEVRLLAPVLPGKIICIGRNYAEHAKEHQVEVPDLPLLFLKPPSAVIGPGDAILLPPQSQRVEHEGELVVVIGKCGRWISPEDALNYVLGYTLGIDVTARDLQRRDGQWTRGKGFDTFCPLGPYIETDFDPTDAMLTTHVNGEMRQMASTRDMIFTVRQLVAYISSVMTLEPGDIIMTGTPAGVGPLLAGDKVKVTIEGLGELTNRVATDNHRPSEI